MLAFFAKNKKSNRSTDRRRGAHSRSIDMITTATKIEINLVVTMMIPWQAPSIINNQQN